MMRWGRFCCIGAEAEKLRGFPANLAGPEPVQWGPAVVQETRRTTRQAMAHQVRVTGSLRVRYLPEAWSVRSPMRLRRLQATMLLLGRR